MVALPHPERPRTTGLGDGVDPPSHARASGSEGELLAAAVRRECSPQMRNRWRLAVSVGLVAVVAACANTVSCSPCAPPAQIEVSSLRPAVDSVRVCLDGECGDVSVLQPNQEAIAVSGSAIYDHSSVTFEAFGDGRRRGSYVLTGLALRRPSGKDCDCGESVYLIPQPGGQLVRKQLGPPGPGGLPSPIGTPRATGSPTR